MSGIGILGSTSAMRAAAEEVLVLAQVLSRTLSELVGTGWAGADAIRLHSEWEHDVTRRLVLAAGELDGGGLGPFSAGGHGA